MLCGERVSQMTKTYNDVEAVTRLLDEVTLKIQYFPLKIIGLLLYCGIKGSKLALDRIILALLYIHK